MDAAGSCLAGLRRHGGEAARALFSTATATTATALALCLTPACERTTHDNIDRWMLTEKGPGKLRSAVGDLDLEPDLRAHAAQNLIRKDKGESVIEIMDRLEPADRQRVLARLVPRLWDDARIEGEMTVPSATQIGAKDALFDLRPLADADSRAAIDRYLTEWLAGGYYEGRSRTGRYGGAAIIRAIGRAAAPKLIERARAVLATPPDAKGGRVKIEEPLLVALAVTGSPEAVAVVLEIAGADRDDPDLAQRAFDALHVAYVHEDRRTAPFEVAGPDALAPHVDALVAVAKDSRRSGSIINDSMDLIGALGPPRCIPPLIELMTHPGADEQQLWVAANAALRCGKGAALVAVADALPKTGSYEQRKLAGAIWEPMARLEDTAIVAEQARVLLGSDSWVSRVVGVELLGHLALRATAESDAARVRKLAGDKTRLRGWWGEQRGVSGRDRKRDPTLGERAAAVADRLERGSQG